MAVCGQNFERVIASIDQAEGEVVVAHAGGRRGLVGGGAGGVIVGQAHDLQARHFAFAFETLQLGDEAFGAFHIGIVHVEAAEPGIEMTLQRSHA